MAVAEPADWKPCGGSRSDYQDASNRKKAWNKQAQNMTNGFMASHRLLVKLGGSYKILGFQAAGEVLWGVESSFFG